MSAGLHVGFVGLGQMGRAMLEGLVEAGFQLTIYDIDPAACAPFDDGDQVVTAESGAAVAGAADVIDIVVNNGDQLVAAMSGEDGLLAGARPGTIVLVHSTIDHGVLRKVHTEAATRGVHVLDAPISGRWGEFSVPELAVMCGGETEAFAVAEPVMHGYGSYIIRVGDLGSGLDTKLALNLFRYLCMLGRHEEAGREARLLLGAVGVDVDFDALADHVGAHMDHVRRGAPPEKLRQIVHNEARFRHNAALARKDLRAAVARGAEVGVELPASAGAIQTIHTYWGLDDSALLEA